MTTFLSSLAWLLPNALLLMLLSLGMCIVSAQPDVDTTAQPTLFPTPIAESPSVAPDTAQENDTTGRYFLLFLVLALALCMAVIIYCSHRRYQRKKKNRQEQRNAYQKHAAQQQQMEMTAIARKKQRNLPKSSTQKKVHRKQQPKEQEKKDRHADGDKDEEEESQESTDIESSEDKQSKESKEHLPPSEGNIVVNKARISEGGIVAEGEIQALMQNAGDSNVDDAAPAAFANFNYDAAAPAMNEVAVTDNVNMPSNEIAAPAEINMKVQSEGIDGDPGRDYDGKMDQDGVQNEHDDQDEAEEDESESENEEEEEAQIQMDLPKEQLEFMIGSYCYVDCDTVYGAIDKELQHGYYLIADFFEQRKRKAHKATLSLIQNTDDLDKAKKQHRKFIRKNRAKQRKK